LALKVIYVFIIIDYKNYYTIHKDDARKERFLSRFSRLRTDDPYKAMFWAEGILWNKKSVEASFRDLKRRYDLKGWKILQA